MAQTKISQLTELSSIADNDVLAGVDISAGTTKKVKMSTLKSYINTGDAQDVQINGTSVVSGNVANIAVEGTYNASTNKLETVNDVNSKTGTLSNLTTTNKTNLVSAINELNTNKEENSNKTTTINENSTDTQYPSAKATYDYTEGRVVDVEQELSEAHAELEQYKTIFNALPKVTGTGEAITLDDTTESPLKMDLKGNTSQVTYTGKNLCDVENVTIGSSYCTYTYSNGVFTMTPTETKSSARLMLLLPKTSFDNNDVYTISANGNNRVIVGYASSIDDTSNYYYFGSSSIGEDYFTFTYTDIPDNYYVSIYLYNTNQTLGTNWSVKEIQLEKNASKTDYEPYVGGSPSPNPSYPQPIQVVSGDNEVVVCGKNILTKNIIYESGGVANSGATKNGFYITVKDNNPTNGFIFVTIGKIKNYENKKLTLSISNTPSELYQYICFATCKTDGSDRNVIASNFGSSSNKVTTTIPSGYDDDTLLCVRIYIYHPENGATYNLNDVQVEINQTVTTYEPYLGTTYPINLGVKNIYNLNDTYYRRLEQTPSEIVINNNQTSITSTSSTAVDYIWWNIPVTPNKTYTISYGDMVESTTNSNNVVKYCFSSSQITSYSSLPTLIAINKNDKHITITPTENYLVLVLLIAPSLSYTINNIQVEEGSKINSYSPFNTTPIEMCKIGDYQDTFKRSTGKNLVNIVSTNQIVYSNSYNNFTLNNGVVTTTGNTLVGFKAKVEPNTQYTLHANKTGSEGTNTLRTREYSQEPTDWDTNFVVQNSSSYASGSATINFTTDSTTQWLLVVIYSSGSGNVISNIQLEKNSLATSYEPYGYGKWYKYGMIGKVVLDGSEDWSYNSTSAYFRCGYDYKGFTPLDSAILEYCNYFKQGSTTWGTFRDDTTHSQFYRLISTGTYKINIRHIGYTTTDDFENWLSTHNTIVYYPLATPIGQSIPDSLAKQLDDIYVALSHQTQTNISQTNNDLPFVIDAQTLLDISNLENRVTLLED